MSWQDRIWKASKLLSFLQVVSGVLGLYLLMAYCYASSSAVSALKENFTEGILFNVASWLENSQSGLIFGGVFLVVLNCVCAALMTLSGADDRMLSVPKGVALLVLRVALYIVVSIVMSKLFNSLGRENYLLCFIIATVGLAVLIALRLVWAGLRKLGKKTFRDYAPSSGGYSSASSTPSTDRSEAASTSSSTDVYKQISKNAYIQKNTYIQVNCFYDGSRMWTIDDVNFRARLEEFSERNVRRFGMSVDPNLFNRGQIVDGEGKICYYTNWFADARGNRSVVKNWL